MVFPWLRRSYESPAIVEAGSGNRVTQTVTVGKPEAVTVIMVARVIYNRVKYGKGYGLPAAE